MAAVGPLTNFVIFGMCGSNDGFNHKYEDYYVLCRLTTYLKEQNTVLNLSDLNAQKNPKVGIGTSLIDI